MTLSDLETLLNAILPGGVYHYGAPPEVPRRIVWAEYGTNDLIGDDAAIVCIPLVQIDVYTQRDDDTLAEDVQTALSAVGQYCSVAGIEFDDEFMSLRTILQLQLI